VTDDKRYLFYSRSADFARVDIYWIRFDSLLETLREGRAAGRVDPIAVFQND
jgi:hypothetical protein